jgi:hypothetical protein
MSVSSPSVLDRPLADFAFGLGRDGPDSDASWIFAYIHCALQLAGAFCRTLPYSHSEYII